jgi:Carboxypeptidase regulatory-like domain
MSLRHLLVVSFVFVASVAAAQTVSMSGGVADPQGAVVSGAVVTLNSSSAAARTTSTNADGTFSFAGVPAGLAETVAVEAPKLEEELPQAVERAGSRIQTITSEQIENGGCYDVGQALQSLVPGLFLAPRAGAFDYVAASLQGSVGPILSRPAAPPTESTCASRTCSMRSTRRGTLEVSPTRQAVRRLSSTTSACRERSTSRMAFRFKT